MNSSARRDSAGLAALLDERARPRPDDGALFAREPSEDRRLFSANDWYACGYWHGLFGIDMPRNQRVRWYCTERGAHEQWNMGYVHGAEMRLRAERDAKSSTTKGDDGS